MWANIDLLSFFTVCVWFEISTCRSLLWRLVSLTTLTSRCQNIVFKNRKLFAVNTQNLKQCHLLPFTDRKVCACQRGQGSFLQCYRLTAGPCEPTKKKQTVSHKHKHKHTHKAGTRTHWEQKQQGENEKRESRASLSRLQACMCRHSYPETHTHCIIRNYGRRELKFILRKSASNCVLNKK